MSGQTDPNQTISFLQRAELTSGPDPRCGHCGHVMSAHRIMVQTNVAGYTITYVTRIMECLHASACGCSMYERATHTTPYNYNATQRP